MWKRRAFFCVPGAPGSRYDPKYCAHLVNWSLRLMSVHCWRCAVLRVPQEARFPVLVWVWTFLLLFGQSWLRWKPPRPPVIGQRILSGNALLRTFVTYRLTFIAQHALLDFLGQDQVARLRSGPVEDYNSPCVPRWAWRGEQHKRALCYHRVNKIELNCARCFWKLPRVNTCAALIVWRCETHKLHSELQNNLKGIAKEKSCC